MLTNEKKIFPPVAPCNTVTVTLPREVAIFLEYITPLVANDLLCALADYQRYVSEEAGFVQDGDPIWTLTRFLNARQREGIQTD